MLVNSLPKLHTLANLGHLSKQWVISNYPLSEGNYLSICLDKDAQRRDSVELKRIDPTLWSKRAEDGDEDEHQMGDRNPIVADMQIE